MPLVAYTRPSQIRSALSIGAVAALLCAIGCGGSTPRPTGNLRKQTKDINCGPDSNVSSTGYCELLSHLSFRNDLLA
jgi:hypothetical protein